MKIAVIGAGKVGGALATRLVAAGHEVTLGLRESSGDKKSAAIAGTATATIAEAAQKSEVVLIAAVPQAAKEIAEQLGDMKEKVLIDAMNSINVKPDPFQNTTEAFRSWTNCPHVVKCFNTTGFENMANPVYGERKIDTFVAGNSEHGKNIAKQLALDIGFGQCYDFGGDERVQLLEHFAMAWINLAILQGNGRDIAFKVIKR